MKIFSRIVMANILISEIFLSNFNIVFSKSVSQMTSADWWIFAWCAISIISGLTWWFWLFFHLKKSQFEIKIMRRIWFLILFFGTMFYLLGPIIYYLMVVEMGKTISKESTFT